MFVQGIWLENVLHTEAQWYTSRQTKHHRLTEEPYRDRAEPRIKWNKHQGDSCLTFFKCLTYFFTQSDRCIFLKFEFLFHEDSQDAGV